MDKNNDFDKRKRNYPSDLDEYVAREIMQYYGEDIVNRAESSDEPVLKRRKISRYRSAVGVICSVMFLIGAIIFSGVVFTSGVPVFKGSSGDSSSESQVFQSTDSEGFSSEDITETPDRVVFESDIKAETADQLNDVTSHSETISSEGGAVSTETKDTESDSDVSSEGAAVSTETKDTESDSDVSSEGGAVSTETKDTEHTESDSDVSSEGAAVSTETKDTESDSDISSEGAAVSTETKDTESDSDVSSEGAAVSTETKDTEHAESESEVSSEGAAVSTETKDTESDSDVSSEGGAVSTETENTESRPTYYSLPEIPDEGVISEIPTDADNNESTNPYDNVTTGKRVKAGIGITLMVMSLMISFALNRIKCEDDDDV